jgi:hypothetical protein
MDMQREPPFRTALVLAMRKDLDLVKKCQATSGFCELLALELRHYVAQGSQVRYAFPSAGKPGIKSRRPVAEFSFS